MMAIRSSDEIIARNMAIIRHNLDLLTAILPPTPTCSNGSGPGPAAPSFVKFKGPLTGNELAARLLERGILVFPPSI